MERRAWDDATITRRLTIATEAARIGLWDWDLNSGEMVYSQRAKLICGFDPDGPVTLEMVRGVTHPEDLPRTWAMSRRAMDPALREHEPYRYRILRADTGELRWILAYGKATFEAADGEQRCVAYTGTIQDITDQKRAEDLLADNEARLRLAIDAAAIAVWEVNLEDGSVTPSPELNVLCGFPPDARPTLQDYQSRYAPGELERLQVMGSEIEAKGGSRIDTDIRLIWPDGTPKWLRLSAQRASVGSQNRVIGVLYDITERKNAEEHSALIARELRHRIKNTLAVLGSIAVQSIRGHADREEGLAALAGRLQTLASAAEAVSEEDWHGTSVVALAERVLAPYHYGERGRRIELEGPDVPLPPNFASTLALALHELATNAVKYGALSVPQGSVRVAWGVTAELRLSLRWTEHNGPAVVSPSRAGFGTKMLERALFASFDGYAEIAYEPAGLSCRILATIPRDETSKGGLLRIRP
jgi:PAS domain S-box-containing protein